MHLGDWLQASGFSTRYVAKGRMAEMVRRIPVFLVNRHDTGLAGAAGIAQQIYRADQ